MPRGGRLRRGFAWFDERTGITGLVHSGLYEAVPERGGWAYTLGSATLVLIILQVFTGIFLLFTYVPSVEEAYSSLDYLRTSDTFGDWVRGIHLWGAYLLLFVIGVHAMRTFLSASYKRPRELNWISGVVLLFLVLGLAVTGAMLPWDQAAYWTGTVVTNIPHYIPGIGDGVRRLWRGGDVVGPLTLTRTFALHIWGLPFLMLSFVAAHLYLLRRHGEFGAWVNYETHTDDPGREITARIRRAEPPYPTKGIEREYAAPEHTVGFFPNQLFKDTMVSLVLVTIAFVFGKLVGAPLDARADPATLTYVPTPEWFYLALDQLLLLTPGIPLIPIGVFLLVGVGSLYMVLLPFIDRSRERRPLSRAQVLIPGLFLALLLITLTLLGVNRLYNL